MKIDIGGEAAKLAVERVAQGIATVFGPAATELGILLGDKVRDHRLKNAIEIQKKYDAILKNNHIEPEFARNISFGESVRAFETGSLEEDETIQTMWASLLYNAKDTRTNVHVEKTFVQLLGSISYPEAIYLNGLLKSYWIIYDYLDCLRKYENQRLRKSRSLEDGTVSDIIFNKVESLSKLKLDIEISCFGEWRKVEKDLQNFSIQNLIRLRCISPEPPMFRPIEKHLLQTSDRRTGRGIEFLEPDALVKVINTIYDRMEILSGTNERHPNVFSRISHRLSLKDFPEFNFTFTPLGARLMKSCNVPTPSSEVLFLPSRV